MKNSTLSTKLVAAALVATFSLGIVTSAHAQGVEMSGAAARYDAHTAFGGVSRDATPTMLPYWNAVKVVAALLQIAGQLFGGAPDEASHVAAGLAADETLFDAPHG